MPPNRAPPDPPKPERESSEPEHDVRVLVHLSPDLLEPSPDDPHQRVRDAAHEKLVASLLAHGQDHSISAYTLEGGRYRIRTGTSIWYAAPEVGLPELRVEVHPPVSRLEALRVLAREEEPEPPRVPYERAQLTGRMRAVSPT